MSSTVDIVQSIVDLIPREIKVSEIQNQGGKIVTCNTLYATEKKIVEDSNGNKYKISGFLENEYLEITPQGNSPEFNDDVIILPKPLFLHGTPLSTNNEYLKVNSRQSKKTPFIWLLESFEEDIEGGDSSLEFSVRCRLFFMDGAIETKLNPEQHRLYIKPMRALSILFKEVVESQYHFKRPLGTTIRPRPRFGVEVTNKGNKRLIFDDNLSGVESVINIEVLDVNSCYDCSN